MAQPAPFLLWRSSLRVGLVDFSHSFK